MLLKSYAAKVILDNVRAGNADSNVNTRLYTGILTVFCARNAKKRIFAR